MWDGPHGFVQGFTCPALLRILLSETVFACTGLSPCIAPLSRGFQFIKHGMPQSYNPGRARDPTGLGWSGFARRYSRNHSCFLLLRVLRCFSSPGSPPDESECHIFNMAGCPIRKSADQGLCAPPRGLSQLITSFIASESLGIPRAPLVSLLYQLALPRTAHRIDAGLLCHK